MAKKAPPQRPTDRPASTPSRFSDELKRASDEVKQFSDSVNALSEPLSRLTAAVLS